MSGQELSAAQSVSRPLVACTSRRWWPRSAACAVAASGACAGDATWSAPRAVETSVGQSLLEVQCPSAAACVAVDVNGRATSFDPASAKASAPVQIAAGEVPMALACPSATQCTIVTTENHAYSFAPTAPKASPPVVPEPDLDVSNDEPPTTDGLACPSTSSCVAADDQGNVITFHPARVRPSVLTSLGQQSWSAAACPSATECIVAGDGSEATFNPAAPSGAASPRSGLEQGKNRIIDLACPSASQCTALDQRPGARSRSTRRRLRRRRPIESQSPVTQPPRLPVPQSTSARRLLRTARSSRSIRRRRRHRSRRAKIDPSGVGGGPGQTEGLTAISCPATTSCVTVDAVGQAIAFAPASPGTPKPTRIDGGSPLLGVSCPSTSQCTAMGPYVESTFDPLSGKAADARDDGDRPLLPGERRGLRHDKQVPGDHHRPPGHVEPEAVQATQDASARLVQRRGDQRDRLPDRDRVRRRRHRRFRASATTRRQARSSSAGSRSRRARR